MAKISKPKRNRKGAPPPPQVTSNNLTKTTDYEMRPLNFKVPADFKKEFKGYAMEMDITMVELLQRSFRDFKNRE